MNVTALVFWAILGILGYLISGVDGALIGVLIGLTLSFIVEVITKLKEL